MDELENRQSKNAMKSLFSFFDARSAGYITPPQLQLLHEEIRIGGISMPQVFASVESKNINKQSIYLSDLPELLQEMDRRYFLVQDLRWEFAMLDRNHTGVIPIKSARFLMEARHGKAFSERSWGRLLSTRPVPDAPISFAEIEVELCNLMQPGGSDGKAAREAAEKAKINAKMAAARRESRLKLELEEKRKEEEEEAKRIAEENELKLETERKDLERKAQRKKEEEERQRRLDEERERNARDAESKDKEAEEEEERARQQERMLLDAAKKEQDARKKKQVEKEAKEATKKAEAAKRQRIRTQLKVAVESQDREKLPKASKNFKEAKLTDDDGDLAKAERLLKMFQCSDELKDAMSKRLIKELQRGIATARKNRFDRQELADLVAQADELLTRLRRLEKLRHEVLELKSSTIAEIRSYQKPPAVVHDVMMATYLLLGTPFKETQKWANVQILLGKTGREGLKRRIGQLNVADVDPSTASKAKSQMGEIDLEMIRDVSAGAATFYIWVEGMVDEVLSGGQ